MKIKKGPLKELKRTDDFFIRFVIVTAKEYIIKMSFVFIYATRECLFKNLDISENITSEDKKKINNFFEEIFKKYSGPKDKLFEKKKHYIICGTTRIKAIENIREEFPSF